MIINNLTCASHAKANTSKFKVKIHTMPWQIVPFFTHEVAVLVCNSQQCLVFTMESLAWSWCCVLCVDLFEVFGNAKESSWYQRILEGCCQTFRTSEGWRETKPLVDSTALFKFWKNNMNTYTQANKADIIHVYLISMVQNRMRLFEKAVCCFIPLTDLNLCTLNHKGQTESRFDSSAAL